MGSLKGIAASSGIAIAKAYRLAEPDLSFEKKTIEDVAKEVEQFYEALFISKIELEAIRRKANTELGADKQSFLKRIYLS